MKGLRTLVRLYKWRLDEKRRRLAELYAVRDGFENGIKEIEAAIIREQKHAHQTSGSQPEIAYAYGAFAQAAIQRRENLQGSISSLDEQVREALEEVAEAFKALKRQEIAADNQEKRIVSARERREQINSDDQAIDSHQRKVAR